LEPSSRHQLFSVVLLRWLEHRYGKIERYPMKPLTEIRLMPTRPALTHVR